MAADLPAAFRLDDMVQKSGAAVKAVSSALYRLKSFGKLHLVGHGLWSLKPGAPKAPKVPKAPAVAVLTPQAALLAKIHAATDKPTGE